MFREIISRFNKSVDIYFSAQIVQKGVRAKTILKMNYIIQL